jgi:hypothetical protein
MSADHDNLDIEFEVMDESSLAQGPLQSDPAPRKVPRQSYRFPIPKIDAVTVQINGQQFDLINIVAHERTGLGVRLRGGETLHLGQQLSGISFKLDNDEFRLEGLVQHISPDNFGNYLCGIELLKLHPEDRQRLLAFVEKLRSELFNKNGAGINNL